jgi:hypothetical protein
MSAIYKGKTIGKDYRVWSMVVMEVVLLLGLLTSVLWAVAVPA